MKIEVKGLRSTMQKLKVSFDKERMELLNTKAIDIVTDLRANTPVDTGLARDSWSHRERLGAVVIENNVPYIEALNNGSSKQAPEFFVEKTLLKHGKPIGQLVKINPS